MFTFYNPKFTDWQESNNFLWIYALTLNEVLVGALLLFLSGLLDVTEELIEVASRGVHLLLLRVAEDLSDVLVGGLEAKTTDKVTDLKSFI